MCLRFLARSVSYWGEYTKSAFRELETIVGVRGVKLSGGQVQQADHIIVMKQGRAIAQGTRPDLPRTSPEMRNLWRGHYDDDRADDESPLV